MAQIHGGNLKIFARLVKSGFTTQKQIQEMGIGELIRIPKITPAEIMGISQLQQAIRAGDGLSFLVDDGEEMETEDEA